MKIEKTVNKQSMLLKLKLIKTKMYSKAESYPNLEIKDVECRLKKGLQVISKYHAGEKKILFVGNLPFEEEVAIKKLLKNTKHVYVPECFWLNGYISSDKTFLSKRSLSQATLQLKRNNHLVIILHDSTNEIRLENYKAKLPTIALSKNLDIFDVTFSYKILGNHIISKEKVKGHLFLKLLESFLK